MLFIIQGKITLIQYFVAMLISTIALLGVVVASSYMDYDKNTIACLMLILTITSLGSSAKIINATYKQNGS